MNNFQIYLLKDGVAVAPTKLLKTVFAKREHFDAELNATNDIF